MGVGGVGGECECVGGRDYYLQTCTIHSNTHNRSFVRDLSLLHCLALVSIGILDSFSFSCPDYRRSNNSADELFRSLVSTQQCSNGFPLHSC